MKDKKPLQPSGIDYEYQLNILTERNRQLEQGLKDQRDTKVKHHQELERFRELLRSQKDCLGDMREFTNTISEKLKITKTELNLYKERFYKIIDALKLKELPNEN